MVKAAAHLLEIPLLHEGDLLRGILTKSRPATFQIEIRHSLHQQYAGRLVAMLHTDSISNNRDTAVMRLM